MAMGSTRTIVAALALALLTLPLAAVAEKGGKHGNGKHDQQDYQNEDHGGKKKGGKDRHDDGHAEFRFVDRDRTVIRDYYGGQARGGHCPPGLAKKGNGCLPPGQAKKWVRGQPLPRDVVFYELPRDLIVRLPPPPTGHRYVRVASDVLLITIGSSMVVDGIQDILR